MDPLRVVRAVLCQIMVTMNVALLLVLAMPVVTGAQEVGDLVKRSEGLRKGGRLAEAEQTARRAMELCEQRFGRDRINCAWTLGNLAGIVEALGRPGEALALHERALAIRERTLGREHPDIAWSLGHVAGLHRAQGRLADAARLYERALAIREKSLGPRHPDIAWSLGNLAGVYHAQGRIAEALGLYQRALGIREAAVGRDHPDVAATLVRLAELHVAAGRPAEAIALYERALAIVERALGASHPQAAETRASLAALRPGSGNAAAAATGPSGAAATTQTAAGPGRRIALVIGNGAYRQVPRLLNPPRDATAIAKTLRALGFSEVTMAQDLTRDGMLAALIAFTERTQDADWAVIYFAGHGIEIDRRNYLIPIDAGLKTDRHVRLEAVALDDVLEAASAARELRLVILDACRDNPFANRMARSDANRTATRGLGRIEPSSGTLVAYSARDGSVARDGDGENSPFATALIQHLGEPDLDIRLMFARVRDSVLRATGNSQEPYTYGSLPGKNLSFLPR